MSVYFPHRHSLRSDANADAIARSHASGDTWFVYAYDYAVGGFLFVDDADDWAARNSSVRMLARVNGNHVAGCYRV